MVGSKCTRSKAAAKTRSGTAETSLPTQRAAAVPVLQQPPAAANASQQPPAAARTSQQPPVAARALQSPSEGLERLPIAAGTATHAAEISAPIVVAQNQGLVASSTLPPQGAGDGTVLEQVRTFPPLLSHLAYATSETLARMHLGPTQFSPPDPRSQADLSLRVDQLTQRLDNQNDLVGQLLRQIDLVRGLGLGPQGEERMVSQQTGPQVERSRAGQAAASSRGRERERAIQHSNRTPVVQQLNHAQISARQSRSRSRVSARLGPRTNVLERLGPQPGIHSRLGTQRSISSRLGPQGPQVRERLHGERSDRRSPTRSRQTSSRRQAGEESSQAQSPNLPYRKSTQGDRPLETEEEVSQSHPTRRRRRHKSRSLRVEDVDKLVNDRLKSLKLKNDPEDDLYKEVDRVNYSPFTDG